MAAALRAERTEIFPDWGTQRVFLADSRVTATGDTELAARFLDTVNVI